MPYRTPTLPTTSTGAELRAIQGQLSLSTADFASLLGVETTTLAGWLADEGRAHAGAMILARFLAAEQARGGPLEPPPPLTGTPACPAWYTRPGRECQWIGAYGRWRPCKGKYLDVAAPLVTGVHLRTQVCERHLLLITHLLKRLDTYAADLATVLQVPPPAPQEGPDAPGGR